MFLTGNGLLFLVPLLFLFDDVSDFIALHIAFNSDVK